MAAQLSLTNGRRLRRAGVVNRAGNQLLSRSGLAEDEDGRVSRRHDLDLLQRLAKTRAVADDRPRADALGCDPRDGVFGMI